MNELRDVDLRQIVAAASEKILEDAEQHVAQHWETRKRKNVDQTIGDQAESGGFGVDIITEIVAMTQYAWTYAQSHSQNVADGVTANALYAVLIAAILKWRGRSGNTGLSEEERQAVAEEIASRVLTTLEKMGRLPSRTTTVNKNND